MLKTRLHHQSESIIGMTTVVISVALKPTGNESEHCQSKSFHLLRIESRKVGCYLKTANTQLFAWTVMSISSELLI